MTVIDVADALDGWTNLRVEKYEDVAPYGRYTPLYNSTNEGWVCLPEELYELEVTSIGVENNCIVVRCDE